MCKGKPEIAGSVSNYEGRFLRFETIEFKDADGVLRKWEAVQRQKEQAAVVIIAMLQPSGRVALVRQFRAPVGAFSLEVPAGLIDDGETPEQAAVRELKEETGYVGTVTWTGPSSSSSAGLSGERVTLVRMTVDEDSPENQHPCQELDEAEDIQVILARKEELAEIVQKALANGDVPDSRLMAWCLGMNLLG